MDVHDPKHPDGTHQIPTEWLMEARVQNFKPTASSFRCDGPHVLILLSDIEMPKRNLGVTLDANGCCHERMLRILTGIHKNDAIPPINVEAADSGQRPYRVRAGFHRFYASLALGFSHVPAEIVDRLD